MKKLLFIFVSACLMFAITACSSQEIEDDKVQESQEETQEQETQESQEEVQEQETQESQEETEDVDYDLTQMSATMVYSQIFDLVSNAHNYLEKTFKMEGVFEQYLITQTNEDVYFVVITDATACCPQGIELSLPEGTSIPEHYANILVQGSAEMYTAFDGNEYLRIIVNSIETV